MKKIIAVAIALCMAVALTACGAINIDSIGIPSELSMETGETSQLEITYEADQADKAAVEKAISEATLTWSSSDESVVKVDENGNLTAISAGEADVTVSALVEKNDLNSTCHVTVTDPESAQAAPVRLVVNGDSVEGAMMIEFAGIEVPEDVIAEELTWKSSDEKVATVDEAGLVTPVGPGSCIIAVSGLLESGDEWAVECNITVKDTVEAFAEDSASEGEAAPVVLNAPAENSGSKTSGASGSSSSGSGKTTGSAGSSGTTASNGTASNPAPAPTPAPQPAQPTPAPQPEVGPSCPTCGLPLWGGPVGNCLFGGNHPAMPEPPKGEIDGSQIVPGGGDFENNGANATPEEEIIPPEPQSVEESAVIEAQ